MASVRRLQTDVKAEVSGVWIQYPGTDVEVLVCRFGNPTFTSAVRARQELEELSLNDVLNPDDTKSRKIVAPLIAQFLWLGTRNLTGPRELQAEVGSGPESEGEVAIGETAESRALILCDQSLRDFSNWVLAQSRKTENFRLRRLETAKGKSES